MKKLVALLIVAVAFATAPAFAGYDEGFSAHENGDYITAMREFRPLANEGNAWAQFYMGRMYDNGHGVPQDDKEAVKWYTLSAKQGNSWAQNNLASKYGKGNGVEQSFPEAFKWFMLSAEQGVAHPQFNISIMYAQGLGVEKDIKKAYMWALIADESEDVNTNKNANKLINALKNELSPKEIRQVKKLANECKQKSLKGC